LTNFTKDLVLPRPDAPINHVVQAKGTSDSSKGKAFLDSIFDEEHQQPTVYTNYNSLYADKQVNNVYVGIPHALHKQAWLAAINAGKHVLCEKPLTINRKEAEEVIAAAKAKASFSWKVSHIPRPTRDTMQR
jgi:dihydrodiol dehydrogenase / D-xylose 1-dehydrogenase (NADP)